MMRAGIRMTEDGAGNRQAGCADGTVAPDRWSHFPTNQPTGHRGLTVQPSCQTAELWARQAPKALLKDASSGEVRRYATRSG